MSDSPQDITQLLGQWQNGDQEALSELTPLVYRELRRLAQSYLSRERPGHTLQGTALVHEAYLRLVDQSEVEWRNRNHFFALSAEIIRRILVDHARERMAGKGAGTRSRFRSKPGMEPAAEGDLDLIALDDALEVLARTVRTAKPNCGAAILCRFEIEETADVAEHFACYG